MDWEVKAHYKGRGYMLQAEKVYESDHVMRIKVYGKTDFILLENDYPFLLFKNSKKAIKWKLKNEGFINMQCVEDCELVAGIIRNLEYLLKGKDQRLQDRINHLMAKP
jgi:hypothetical protein